MKSGFVAIVGRPNSGKSTLINAILNKKVSIVSEKSQTTRNNIKGIYNDEDSQIVFVDTPGIHKSKVALGNEMNSMAYNSMNDVDLVLLVVDASEHFGIGDEFIIEKIKGYKCPTIVVFNKIDKVNINQINKLKQIYNEKIDNCVYVETVALEGFNIDALILKIKSFLNEGPQYYGKDTYTDKDEIFQIKEIIREKILKQLKQEVPHAIAIYMDDIDWDSNPINIKASIVVEKDSQKGIVIGKNGDMIKRIGKLSRVDIEKLLNKHIYLELMVKVDEDWRNNKSSLKKFGYIFDKK